MNSRFLERLRKLVDLSDSPYEKACLNLEVASYFARRGDSLESSRIANEVREGGLHFLSANVGAWLNFVEGMQFHCRGCDQEARVKWSRCIAIARSGQSNEVLARAFAWLAFVEYTNLRIESLFKYMNESSRLFRIDDQESCARVNLTCAQIYHLCGNFDMARDFYDKSRSACLESGDDVMLAALIHNMAWLRMSALRNDNLRGSSSKDDSGIVKIAAESTRNYENIIGLTGFDVMTPLLKAQVDIIHERYTDAIEEISVRLKDLDSQGLSRLNASLIADRAYCRAKLGDIAGARDDALVATQSASDDDHVDDLAVLYTRVARVYELTSEMERSVQCEAKAKVLWERFESLQECMLLEMGRLSL